MNFHFQPLLNPRKMHQYNKGKSQQCFNVFVIEKIVKFHFNKGGLEPLLLKSRRIFLVTKLFFSSLCNSTQSWLSVWKNMIKLWRNKTNMEDMKRAHGLNWHWRCRKWESYHRLVVGSLRMRSPKNDVRWRHGKLESKVQDQSQKTSQIASPQWYQHVSHQRIEKPCWAKTDKKTLI